MRIFALLSGAFLLLSLQCITAQSLPGKLLVVGGGSENYNNWSDTPYSWAVEQSENKRVAIIGTDSGTSDWLPDYFTYLGATYARSFPITTTATADLQATYDSLITYDVIFFRGGNQWNYYNRYRNTLTQQAVEDVFMNGGVIGGTSAGLHILSEVLFTAQNGTVYPEEALQDPFNQYMTLGDDFLNLMPGLIFDSHFVERARFGRLLGFLGNWKLAEGADIIGVGVDDKTALCIDSNLDAYVFGTGAVNIYKAGPENAYAIGGTKLLATDIEVMQMLHECTFNFNSFEYSGLPQKIIPQLEGEVFAKTLWLSGADALNKNLEMLQQIASEQLVGDTILVISSNQNTANQFAGYLGQQGADAAVMLTNSSNGASLLWKSKIENAPTILFVANTYTGLMDFLHETTNGQLLLTLLRAGQKDVAFVGGNSRFAGKSFIANYEQEYASYDGLLEIANGMALLANTVIMPNAFSSSIDNENAASGLPYAMVADSLSYGIWLYDNNFARYSLNGNSIEITSFGDFPMIFIENRGTDGGLGTQSAVGSGLPRNVAGFGRFNLSLMDESMSKQINYISQLADIQNDKPWYIYPNPSLDYFHIEGLGQSTINIEIWEMAGQKLDAFQTTANSLISISSLAKGMYIITILDQNGKWLGTQKLVKQ
jgi:cyanophycinase